MTQLLGVVILIWLLAPLYSVYKTVKKDGFNIYYVADAYLVSLSVGGIILLILGLLLFGVMLALGVIV